MQEKQKRCSFLTKKQINWKQYVEQKEIIKQDDAKMHFLQKQIEIDGRESGEKEGER
jgi:hypothetical protein